MNFDILYYLCLGLLLQNSSYYMSCLRLFLLLLLFLGVFGTSGAQVDTLQLNSGLMPGPSTCGILRTGTTQSFYIGSSCGASIRISDDLGQTTVYEVTAEEYASGEFEYRFDVPGEYVIFCNGGGASLLTSSRCYLVADPVPTTGEWGLVIIFLLLLIQATVVIKTRTARAFS